jgi:hypothetical protein
VRSVVDLNISVFLVHLYMCLEFFHFNFSFGTKSSLDLLDPIHNPSNVKFGFLVRVGNPPRQQTTRARLRRPTAVQKLTGGRVKEDRMEKLKIGYEMSTRWSDPPMMLMGIIPYGLAPSASLSRAFPRDRWLARTRRACAKRASRMLFMRRLVSRARSHVTPPIFPVILSSHARRSLHSRRMHWRNGLQVSTRQRPAPPSEHGIAGAACVRGRVR